MSKSLSHWFIREINFLSSQKAFLMKNKKLILVILLIDSLVFAGFIINYYWSTNEMGAIQTVPFYLMFIAIAYIIVQILKRYLTKSQNWWDWMYYIGLTSMMLPIFFVRTENLEIFNAITDYGSFFFVIPVGFDLKAMLNKSQTSNS